jgi:cyclopropane fatty-acyl-phospholipid synthase-like methyltransferase
MTKAIFEPLRLSTGSKVLDLGTGPFLIVGV